MLNEVQKEHQDDHNIPMKKRKKKNPEPLILPGPEKKDTSLSDEDKWEKN